MKIKRYLDADMRRVLRRVREDQGPDAVILSNRRTDEGIEVIAAIDYDESLLQQAFGPKPDVADYLRAAEPAATAPAASEAASLDRLDDEPVAVIAAELKAVPPETELVQAVPPVSATEHAPVEPARADPAHVKLAAAGLEDVGPLAAIPVTPADDSKSLDRMWSEISSIRGLMESQLSELIWKEQDRRSPMRAQMLRNLARIGIASDIAEAIVRRLGPTSASNEVWRAPLTELVEMMPVAADDLLSAGGVVALIGPTGVGKTTTIAKIATRFAMTQGSDELALVCADTYRIGAREHLAAFGQIIGAPVHTLSEPAELSVLLETLKSKKLVLIDTDGVSQRDTNLSQRLEGYARHLDGVRFYLTLSAASQEATLDETIRRFRGVPLAGAIVSKIDEAAQLGCVMSALIRNRLPALWFSDGQKIPDDLHEATQKKLWLLTQAMACVQTSRPKVDEQIMAQQYAFASVAHA